MITESRPTRKPREMYRTIVDEPFKCGFDPTKHNFREYAFHIERCWHADCKRRWENHQILKRELCGK
jgi:hypothetical protein